MTRTLNRLARSARTGLFAAGTLAAGGAVLIGVGEPAVGWSLHIVGMVGAVLAFAGMAGMREAADGEYGWTAVAVLFAGVGLAMPEMLMIWGLYAQNSLVHALFMPYAATPLGIIGGVVAWIGFVLGAIATVRGHGSPPGVVILTIGAALIALPAEVRLLPQVFWVAGFVMLSAALSWLAITARRPTQATAQGS